MFFMQLEIGSIFEGKVSGITKYGVFVDLPDGNSGMVHISEISDSFVREIRDYVTENQVVKVKFLGVNEQGKISLSMKAAQEKKNTTNYQPKKPNNRFNRNNNSNKGPGSFEWSKKNNNAASFEDMLSKFKQTSDEKISDLKRTTESKRGGFSRRGSRS